MKHIVAFAGSNSSKSINRELTHYACTLIDKNKAEVTIIDLGQYKAPIYGIDLEESEGIPKDIKALRELILKADAFIVATPEHNGMVPTFFKNYIDWLSRVDDNPIFNNKPMLLMSTSPGKRGGLGVLEGLVKVLPYRGVSELKTFSFPSFYENFKEAKIVSPEYDNQLRQLCAELI